MAAKYKYYITANRQTPIDIAMTRYGCAEGVVQLIADNPFITSPTDFVAPGTRYRVLTTVPEINTTNLAVAKTYAERGTLVSTGTMRRRTPPVALLNEDGTPLLGENGAPLLNQNQQ